jgi:hypothetical protein
MEDTIAMSPFPSPTDLAKREIRLDEAKTNVESPFGDLRS